jgi:hypothetical protein
MYFSPCQIAWGGEGLWWQSEEPRYILLRISPEIPHAIERKITRRLPFAG